MPGESKLLPGIRDCEKMPDRAFSRFHFHVGVDKKFADFREWNMKIAMPAEVRPAASKSVESPRLNRKNDTRLAESKLSGRQDEKNTEESSEKLVPPPGKAEERRSGSAESKRQPNFAFTL